MNKEKKNQSHHQRSEYCKEGHSLTCRKLRTHFLGVEMFVKDCGFFDKVLGKGAGRLSEF